MLHAHQYAVAHRQYISRSSCCQCLNFIEPNIGCVANFSFTATKHFIAGDNTVVRVFALYITNSQSLLLLRPEGKQLSGVYPTCARFENASPPTARSVDYHCGSDGG